MKITYGVDGNVIDVTRVCSTRLLDESNVIRIPSGDANRARHFTDPIVGTKKKVFVERRGAVREFDDYVQVNINTRDASIDAVVDAAVRLEGIHAALKVKHGSMDEELPEQKMAVTYLKGHEKVLEIGGNVGRNSLVIASVLQDAGNLLTLESDVNTAVQLAENRDMNGMGFNIESSALSKKKLIQRGWETEPSETLKPGFSWVNTITLEQLRAKYGISFDTLVLDCEGAFYHILTDMPEILDNISLIIMENDYGVLEHKEYIDCVMKGRGFCVDYAEAGGWGPCHDRFFEVWKKAAPE